MWIGDYSSEAVPEGGELLLEGIEVGERELIVQAPGYQTYVTRVDLVEGGVGEAEVKLVPVKGELRVSSSPGARVTAIDERGRSIVLGVLPRSGMLEVNELLRIGNYTIRIEKEKYTPVEETIAFRHPISAREKSLRRSRSIEHPPGGSHPRNGS